MYKLLCRLALYTAQHYVTLDQWILLFIFTFIYLSTVT